MKFSKTFCKPNASCSPVPVGIPTVLEYNEYGLLKKARIGFSIDLDPMYEDSDAGEFNYNEFFLKVRGLVPGSITTTGGTTWVFGVLYTDNIPTNEGMLPQALYKSLISQLVGGQKFEFYAGYVKSRAVSFQGPLIIRNFLSREKFNLLPQVIVPLTMTDATLQRMMNPGAYPFKYAFLAGFFIFEDLDCRYAAVNLLQINVTKDIEPFVDADGFVKGQIVTASGRTYTFNYSAILHHGVIKGCTLLVERDNASTGLEILSTRLGQGVERVAEPVLHDIKCPVCGKIFRGGDNDSPIQCDDPHCLSHGYQEAVKMLTTLKLPTLSYNSYKALVDSKKIVCLTDLIDLPPCQEVEIKTTLATAIRAAVPVSVVPTFDILERFANKCNNKVESVMYYLNNPGRIEPDLDITDPIIRRFAKWLQDPYNVSTLTTIFSRVKIDNKLQKFDGAPIFRGVTLGITGKFKRGDYAEIESILRSYAADVVSSIEPGAKLPDAIIVGGLNDGISGQMIQKARIHNIPLQEEDDFFTRYEIDQDMAQNLL